MWCTEGWLARLLKWIVNRPSSVTTADYEVLGLGSDGRHSFWIFFLALHGMSSV